ncbi:TPA: hypothetical protein N0F65_002681 [Lagenidium giganteum]|uniref:Uncharacterized protein n=1 Tax=Lagenidium giganteum TaxID=4803 RepID=A0AAV2Z3W6_9STRA|nr:TPA: hypothetical protein N0F65_002681 [Lagenidium giganteum]
MATPAWGLLPTCCMALRSIGDDVQVSSSPSRRVPGLKGAQAQMQAAKVAVLATVVYIYNHPEVLTQYARAEGEVFDADVENARAKALQFLLTSVSYVLALMFSPRTFLVIVVILLQISCWGMLMINTRFLPVEGIDVKTEKVVLAWASSALYTILLLLTLFGGRHESREEKFRKRLTTFYKKHNPSKLDEIEQIMEKYHDNEDLLFTRLHRKYNALAWEARRADDQQEDSPDDSTDVAKMPAPGMNAPLNLSFSPDGQLVAFLHSKENELTRQLYALDVASKHVALLASPPNQGNTEANLTLEEKLRRERQRQMGVGITSYAWCPTPHSKRVLYPLQGDLYMQEHPGAPLQLLFDKQSTGAAGGAIDPQFSPDGRWIAFVQDREVYVVASELGPDGAPQQAVQVTSCAREHVGRSHGLACFLTQEELSRYRGFWWSPDGSHLAFEEIDEAHIPEFRIMHSGSADVGAAAQEDHRYPFAGAENPKRRLGVVAVRKSNREPLATPVWMNFDGHNDFYVSRVNWLPDHALGVQVLNRLQTEVTFLRFDPVTGQSSVLIHEANPVWVNTNYLYRNIETENKLAFRFIWGSERSGFMHLYLYEYVPSTATAQLLGALTGGDWCVESIEGIDLSKGKVYFCGTKESALERHLYVTSLFPSPTLHEPVRLTPAEGLHTIVMDSACKLFVDVYSNLDTPPRAALCHVPGDELLGDATALFHASESTAHTMYSEVESRATKLISEKKLVAPKIISFPTRDGTQTLYGAIYLPDAEIHGPGPYPTLVSVYGGPHVQRVARMWSMTVDMRAQRFRDMGYAVLKVDNRGSFRRGSAFEGAIKHRMGTIEILDQQDGVNKLIQEGITIADRVGMYGWSYGGYMSAICLMKAPETFKLAIAGAPVTSWDGYDTCYTERYMSTPQLNPDGYREGSVMEAVHKMQAHQKLLLIHGLIDENVHFRHTARLINSLIQARKHYDLLLFPGERHSPRSLEDRIYMEQRIAEYVATHL